MSACDPLSYSNVSPEAWNAVKVYVAADYHVTIQEDAGTQTGDGFELSWAYAPVAKTLAIQCLDSPWWAACSMINSTIDGMIKPILVAYP
jgi:hypothetical protein